MLILQGITYAHPNGEQLFSDLHLAIGHRDKIAIIGNNGTGKSTLLQVMAGVLRPAQGTVIGFEAPWYVPQLLDTCNDRTVAEVLQVSGKLDALRAIINGDMTDERLALLGDDWNIEDRCMAALAHWDIAGIDMQRKMDTLSGGQKTKVFLAGILIHNPAVILLDEPSNHLDMQSRHILYDYIQRTKHTVIVVSHDKTLLNLVHKVCELSSGAITVYGGNYDFYAAQKLVEKNARLHDLKSKEKELLKARKTEREILERKQKLDARGKKKQEQSGLPTISMNTLRNNAENSAARLKGTHREKITTIVRELKDLRNSIPDEDSMKVNLGDTALHNGKILVSAININFGYASNMLWRPALTFQIVSGDRIAISGQNGIGKTTLLKIILGALQPQQGAIQRADMNAVYIDQDYSILNPSLSVFEQAQIGNKGALQEHEIKIRLARFLFSSESWNKSCASLSGGEKMRLIICCLTIATHTPDIIVLDEPTNNLDIQNVDILAQALNDYKGTLLAISHDITFLQQINIRQHIIIK